MRGQEDQRMTRLEEWFNDNIKRLEESVVRMGKVVASVVHWRPMVITHQAQTDAQIVAAENQIRWQEMFHPPEGETDSSEDADGESVVLDSEADEPRSSTNSSYPPIPIPPPPGLQGVLVGIKEGELEVVDQDGNVVDELDIALGVVMVNPPPAYDEIFGGALEELTNSEGEDE